MKLALGEISSFFDYSEGRNTGLRLKWPKTGPHTSPTTTKPLRKLDKHMAYNRHSTEYHLYLRVTKANASKTFQVFFFFDISRQLYVFIKQNSFHLI